MQPNNQNNPQRYNNPQNQQGTHPQNPNSYQHPQQLQYPQYPQHLNYAQQQGSNLNQSFLGFGQQPYGQPNTNDQYRNESFPNNPRVISNNSSEQSFIQTISEKTSQKSMFQHQREIQQKMRIIPKQNDFKSIQVQNQKLTCQKKRFLTNLFQYNAQQSQKVFIYKVQTIPPIKPDATKTWYRVINSIKFQLERQIKMITFRADTIWAEVEKQTFSTTTILDRNKKPLQQHQQQKNQSQIAQNTYNVFLTHCTPISFDQMYQQENKSLKPLFIQMVNTKIKQKLSQIGFEQLGKGKFYNRQKINDSKYENKSKFGINVLNGFRFTLCCYDLKKNYMQIDVSSRILRTRSFYEDILAAQGTEQDKKKKFQGATVITRYGNHKTYKIDSIEYDLTINSYFEVRNSKVKQKITYKQYYEKQYQVKIYFDNQPLVSAIAKTDKKIGKGQKMTKQIRKIYLVPELISLTGLDQSQRQNQQLMQEIAKQTKLQPKARIQWARMLIQNLQKRDKESEKKDIGIGNHILMQGYQLHHPQFKRDQSIYKLNPYNLTYPQQLGPVPPFELNYDDLVFLYSQRTKGEDINKLYSCLATACHTFKINIPENPQLICIQQSDNRAIFIKSMYKSIEKYCKKYLFLCYTIITDTLSKQGGCLSIAGKIGLQMAAKKGFPIWEVQKMHPYWQDKKIASSSMSYSRSINRDFTLGFVGTTNNSQTKIYSDVSVKIPRKESVPPTVLIGFYKNWIFQYIRNQKIPPSTLIIYREGLSQAQINKRVTSQVQCLEEVIFKEIPNWKPQYKDYSPEIIFLIVNKNVRSRFYDMSKQPIKKDQSVQNPQKTKNLFDQIKIQNPTSGSVIYCQLANNKQIDFFLIPQKAEVGTVTPTQYKLAYYHPQNTPKNSNFEGINLPLHAIAQFTFQQCFNYYNWDGVVKLPAALQYAHKLAKMAGQHIKRPVNLMNFQMMVKSQAQKRAQNAKPQQIEQIKVMMGKKLQVCKALLNSFYFL